MIMAASVLLLSSCGTYTGEGAYAGATFGSILGSAIGGISGGWHGSDVGTIVGMAGGAVVGAAIGAAADRQEQERYEVYQQERAQHRSVQRSHAGYDDDSGYDATGSGDDRIDFDAPGPRTGRDTCTAAPLRTNVSSEGAGRCCRYHYNPQTKEFYVPSQRN